MSKHTPGPWRNDGSGIIQDGAGEFLATVHGAGPYVGDDYDLHAVCEANARLIAVGPELLAACEAALDTIRRHCRDVLDTPPEGTVFADLWRQLREAVGKAV